MDVELTARILVAEDVAVNQEVTQELLRQAGFECDCVTNGEDAVTAALNGNYDLLLMDCQMPGTDGYTATQRIREAEAKKGGPTRPLPIVALTATAVDEELARCLEVGMNAHLTKPVDPEALHATIRACLRNEALPQTPSPTRPTGEDAPIFDRAVFLRRCGNRIDLVQRVMGRFIQQAQDDLAELKSAVDRGDAEVAARLGRRFCGAASDLAAEPLRAAAAEVENAAREEPSEALTHAAQLLATEFERLKQQLVKEELPKAA
jgi:CheY-like chemotaxis protein